MDFVRSLSFRFLGDLSKVLDNRFRMGVCLELAITKAERHNQPVLAYRVTKKVTMFSLPIHY